MGRPLRALPLLAITFGCAELRLEIDLPTPEGMRSLVLVVEHDGEVTAHGINLEHPGALNLPHLEPFRGEARLHGLYYAGTLGDLEVGAGPLPLVDAGAPGRPVPPPDLVLEARVAINALSDWVPADAPPIELSRPHLPNEHPHCFPFRHRLFPLGTRQRVYASIEEDGAVLAFSNVGEVFRITSHGVTREPSPLEIGGADAAAHGEGGELWLGATNSRGLFRGRRGQGFERVDPGPARATRFLARPPPGADVPFELFALSTYGALDRFDGQRWSPIVNVNVRESPRFGALEWVAPGEVVFVPSYSGKLYAVKGLLTNALMPVLAVGDFNAVTTLASGEVVAATDHGAVFVVRERQLIPSITEPVTIRPLRTMQAFGPGFAMVSRGLHIHLGVLDRPLCPPVSVEGGADMVVVHSARLGDAVVFFTADGQEADGETETQALILELEPAEGDGR